MIMVEQQTGTLLVGVIEGHAAVRGAITVSGSHIRHIRDTDALRPGGHLRRLG